MVKCVSLVARVGDERNANNTLKREEKMKKIICYFLIACLLCAGLVACNDGGASTDGGEKGDAWANLDFKDATLSVSVSINDPFQTTFQNSAVYMKGPDNAATSEPVQKKVLARNKKVCDDLNIKIEYQETDWRYDEVLPHLLAGTGSVCSVLTDKL